MTSQTALDPIDPKGAVALLREIASAIESGEATLTFILRHQETLQKKGADLTSIEALIATGDYTVEITYKNVEEAKKCVEAFAS